MSKLAIIIPAYKETYLDQALESISNQTCKDFTVYIGDDNSPYPIKDIIKYWETSINIKYTCFDRNVGGIDLISQWHRCIDLIQDEEWIWLFSDDDIMDINCVEQFYNTIKANPNVDLFHFNTIVIDENGNKWRKPTNYKEELSCADYIDLCFKWKDRTNAICFIFRREKFFEVGRFEYFDLAWGSDNATWVKLSKENGIINVNSAFVYWRYGGSSISSTWTNETIIRKRDAFLRFLKWRFDYCERNKIISTTPKLIRAIYIARNVRAYSALTFNEKNKFLRDGLRILSCGFLYYCLMFLLLWPFFYTYTKVSEIHLRR